MMNDNKDNTIKTGVIIVTIIIAITTVTLLPDYNYYTTTGEIHGRKINRWHKMTEFLRL